VRRGRREDADGFSLSFLDCICCGFGAIVLLLVLTKIGEPAALERAREELDGQLARLQLELAEIRGETRVLERDRVTREEQLSSEREKIARLSGDLSRIEGEFSASRQQSEVQDIVEGRLLAAKQELTEEMKRLLDQRPRRKTPADRTVGGIPVDSEYVIFVIDTSGSMQGYTWSLVVEKMAQVLDIYPNVKGLQVMNDMGQYMFPQYAGKWIPDTPARRRAVLTRLRTWQPFSNSSPVEGVTRAIQSFAARDKRVSVYVFGDEFTGRSITDVLHAIERINTRDEQGQPRVRINAIGFPVMFTQPGVRDFTGERFATLMRELCRENGGTFVGLNRVAP
jgi:hypothetical protein